jgi:hypothetical protein
MEKAGSSETTVNIYHTTWSVTCHRHYLQNLKSYWDFSPRHHPDLLRGLASLLSNANSGLFFRELGRWTVNLTSHLVPMLMMCWDLHPLPPYIIKARCLSTHVTFVPFSTHKSGTRTTPQTLLLYPNCVTFIYEHEWRPVWTAEPTCIHSHAGRALGLPVLWGGLGGGVFCSPGHVWWNRWGGARSWRRSVGIPELPHLWTTKCQRYPIPDVRLYNVLTGNPSVMWRRVAW